MTELPALPPIRSWLYAPGNNARLLDRVFTGGADAVILDLEDAVPPAEKSRARQMVADTVRQHAGQAGPLIFVRVNHPATGLAQEDVRAVVGPGLAGLRIPKVESAETVALIDGWAANSVPLVCNIESAAGVLGALEIARATPRLLAFAFGAADFLGDVTGSTTPDAVETLYARSHLVLAARVANLRPPVEGIFPYLDDLEGLAATTRQSRALGFFGRSALHPRQVPTINAVFTPDTAEIERARAIVAAAASAAEVGTGALQLPGGDFVDVAIVRRAEATLRLVDALAGGAQAT